MNYKNTVKKHGIIIAICVICSVLLITGTSYAIFSQINVNTENQVVRTGKLAITYGSSSKRITDISLYPMSDQDALDAHSTSSSVVIENTGSLPANYQINIGKDMVKFNDETNEGAEFVDLQYVKVAAFIGEEQILEPKRLVDLQLAQDSDDMYKLYTGSLDVGETENVVVKVWLSEDTLETEIGKYLYLKLEANSVVDEDNTPEGQSLQQNNNN